jgi:hypothetical protein
MSMKRFAVLLAALACCSVALAEAGKVPAAVPEQAPLPAQKAIIELRFVAPEKMVNWLEALPKEGAKLAQPYPVMEMPSSIKELKALPAQNAIEAHGTATALNALRQIVKLLDVPQQFVAVEAAFYSISRGALESLVPPPREVAPNPQNDFKLGFLGRNESQAFHRALRDGQAKLLSEEKRRSLNNEAVVFESKLETGKLTEAMWSKLSVTPTLNGDGTITVLMQPELRKVNWPADRPIPSTFTKTVHTIAIVRDFDSLILTFLPHPEEPQQRLVYVLTVSRVKEKEAIAPTKT